MAREEAGDTLYTHRTSKRGYTHDLLCYAAAAAGAGAGPLIVCLAGFQVVLVLHLVPRLEVSGYASR